jgi:hypothetical protein
MDAIRIRDRSGSTGFCRVLLGSAGFYEARE